MTLLVAIVDGSATRAGIAAALNRALALREPPLLDSVEAVALTGFFGHDLPAAPPRH